MKGPLARKTKLTLDEQKDHRVEQRDMTKPSEKKGRVE